MTKILRLFWATAIVLGLTAFALSVSRIVERQFQVDRHEQQINRPGHVARNKTDDGYGKRKQGYPHLGDIRGLHANQLYPIGRTPSRPWRTGKAEGSHNV